MKDTYMDISDKEKILSNPNLAKWQKDLVYGTVVNREKPGDNIKVNPNGKNYLFYDGQVGWIPRVCANILNKTGYKVPVRHGNANLDQGEQVKMEFRTRFIFIEAKPGEERPAGDVAAETIKKLEQASKTAQSATEVAQKEAEARKEAEEKYEALREEMEAMRNGVPLEEGEVPDFSEDEDDNPEKEE